MVPSWTYIVPTRNHMVPIKPVNLHFLIWKYLGIGFSKNRFHIQHHKNILIVSSTLKSWKIPTFFFEVEKLELYSSNLEQYSSNLELYGSTSKKKVGIFQLLRVEETISIFLWCWMWDHFFENPILRYFKIRKCRFTGLIGTIWFQVGTI